MFDILRFASVTMTVVVFADNHLWNFEYRISNRRRESLGDHHFDIRNSMFDILRFASARNDRRGIRERTSLNIEYRTAEGKTLAATTSRFEIRYSIFCGSLLFDSLNLQSFETGNMVPVIVFLA